MLIDSHCHINFNELYTRLPEVLKNMERKMVNKILCASVNLTDLSKILSLTHDYSNIYASIGIHPKYNKNLEEPNLEKIVSLSSDPKIIAIGETGLDYFNLKDTNLIKLQHQRFRTHIKASLITKKPLIIHNRLATNDIIKILKEEKAIPKMGGGAGGVIHCFTESLDVAREIIELGFYISFSGIVTFKNSKILQKVMGSISLKNMLIETDSPYLSPIPHRGKVNEPAFLYDIAKFIANFRNTSVTEIGKYTSDNFYKLFNVE
ncbi:TatD family hydrolase [Candidatus Profftella armatura]|uniref:TatD family hydrolase n=1 Tax=Candidatus Profftella armatura TaxID=669502 RepID=UPI0015DC73AF|nr:TatD family hydrolase [Candidatus Profftella armatura]QLK13954.1 TatD family deoxyribonuclease [Candidatus Profftella armatura]